MLKQGLGRLIRSASDRGILAVLDSRLLHKPYGRRFLESLPPARLVHDVEAVSRFMGRGAAPHHLGGEVPHISKIR
jgi:ATP-dependent DNA helicase DinG